MNYKTYAEAKIANPDSEIVTTSKNWSGHYSEQKIGTFEKQGCHIIRDNAWVICNPADHCSSLKEFFDAKLTLDVGDKIISKSGKAHAVKSWISFVDCEKEDGYILSAAALNGGCKIPSTAQWTIYNNTMPLCGLTDEQYGKMRRMHDDGAVVEFANVTNEFKFEVIEKPNWCKDQVYRIKPKSERELFITRGMDARKGHSELTAEQMSFAAAILFDSGARYSDKTQFFGESI